MQQMDELNSTNSRSDEAIPEILPMGDAADLAAAAGGVESHEARVSALEAEVADLKEQYLRARADVENVRRRAADEVLAAQKFGVTKLATELLGVKDSLEMALLDQSGQFDTLKMGVDMTLKQLSAAFDKVQLQEIHPMGEKLDPHRHQAISMEDNDAEANTVIRVMQKGYLLADRVLRPAMVVVSKGR